MTEITTLSDEAVEESTFVATATFKDEDGTEITPNSVTWTLTDEEGTVINSKEDETETPATTVNIVLSGDDLALQSGEGYEGFRKLLVYGTYNSDLGSNLPYKAEARFKVINLEKVT
jgi:hypothetical protein